MTLANDVVVLVMDAFEDAISSNFTFTFSFRTSPPNDLKTEIPCGVFRNISENERIRNVNGTRFRTGSATRRRDWR